MSAEAASNTIVRIRDIEGGSGDIGSHYLLMSCNVCAGGRTTAITSTGYRWDSFILDSRHYDVT